MKILISLGGAWSTHFFDAALRFKYIEVFAQRAVSFRLKHRLDGIDLDWEYPGLKGDNNVFRE